MAGGGSVFSVAVLPTEVDSTRRPVRPHVSGALGRSPPPGRVASDTMVVSTSVGSRQDFLRVSAGTFTSHVDLKTDSEGGRTPGGRRPSHGFVALRQSREGRRPHPVRRPSFPSRESYRFGTCVPPRRGLVTLLEQTYVSSPKF